MKVGFNEETQTYEGPDFVFKDGTRMTRDFVSRALWDQVFFGNPKSGNGIWIRPYMDEIGDQLSEEEWDWIHQSASDHAEKVLRGPQQGGLR